MESSLRIERGDGKPPRPHLRRASTETVAGDVGCVEKRRRARIDDRARDAIGYGSRGNFENIAFRMTRQLPVIR